jgi:hypothetical protein
MKKKTRRAGCDVRGGWGDEIRVLGNREGGGQIFAAKQGKNEHKKKYE